MSHVKELTAVHHHSLMKHLKGLYQPSLTEKNECKDTAACWLIASIMRLNKRIINVS